MKLYTYVRVTLIFFVILLIFYFYSIRILSGKEETSSEQSRTKKYEETTGRVEFKRHDIVVAVVACGDRFQETLIMLKSALMFSKQKLNFIVFSEDSLIDSFNQKLSEWTILTHNKFTYTVMPLTFPTKNADEWKKLFKPCASQRLFLPTVLKDVDSVLYMDTDTLFLSPVENIWSHFHKMNSSQMAALAPEHEDPNVGWYNRFAKHPYYGKLGVNSGVMLMNLTRMRQFQWTEYVVPIYKKFKLKITWGDQDIINIIFHYHPGKLYIYPCRYNFRPDHCMYMSVCKSAEKFGVAVVHGSRGFFHSEKQPVFKALYRAFEEFSINGDIYTEFYLTLETYLEQAENSNCGHVKDVFFKNLKNFIDLTQNTSK